jgi:hypothetical protein
LWSSGCDWLWFRYCTVEVADISSIEGAKGEKRVNICSKNIFLESIHAVIQALMSCVVVDVRPVDVHVH